MKHVNRKLAILILILGLSFPVFAQDETPTSETLVTETPVTEPTPADDTPILADVDNDIVMLISSLVSIVAVVGMAMFTVSRMGGTTKEALLAGVERGTRTLISDEGLSTTVEQRLNAIPQQYRNFLMELVNLASPITETSIISKDASKWLHNVLDGNLETGAVPFTANSTSEGFFTRANTETPHKSENSNVQDVG